MLAQEIYGNPPYNHHNQENDHTQDIIFETISLVAAESPDQTFEKPHFFASDNQLICWFDYSMGGVGRT